MIYTAKQLEEYARILAFSASPELHVLLLKQDKALAEEVTKFHVMVTIIDALSQLKRSGYSKISFYDLRDQLDVVTFKRQTNLKELEKRLEQYLPVMIREGLLTSDLNPTVLGDQALQAKIAAFHVSELTSTELN